MRPRRVSDILARVRETADTFQNRMFGDMFYEGAVRKYVHGDSALMDFVQQLEQTPVDIETFLDSEDFLGATDISLWPEVRRAVIEINKDWWRGPNQSYEEALLMGATGTGKCLGEGTPVVMYDGSVKKVQDIAVGDLLLGPDSQPRRVVSTTTGIEEMFRVTPVCGDPYEVNRSHILSLKITGLGKNRHGNRKSVGTPDGRRFYAGDIANVSVDQYVQANATFRHCAKGWRSGAVTFPSTRFLPVDPYIVGAWLGDGTSKALSITNEDPEVMQAWQEYAESRGLKTVDYTYGDRASTIGIAARYRGMPNPLLEEMQVLGLCLGRKFIPDRYKRASIEDRLQLLAGLIDTDGTVSSGVGFDYITKSRELADDVLFLVRSLGFAAQKKQCRKKSQRGTEGIYWRIYIAGDLRDVPCRIPRKRINKVGAKDTQLSAVSVKSIGRGRYYGFTLEGPDRLFLLGDFTVTHNTELSKITTAYHLHILGCLKNPQAIYGLPKTTAIIFAIMAAKPHVTKRVVYTPLRSNLEAMPWFQEHMRINPLIESEIYIAEKNIRIVMGGADQDSILGEAVIGGIIDEVNFMNVVLKSKKAEVSTGRAGVYDQAAGIYGAMTRRKKSRFITRGPQVGIVCVASSTRYKGDFTDKRRKEIRDLGVKTSYVYDKKQYEVWPQDRYCGETFRLLVGNEVLTDTRVLESDEVVPEGALVLDVPVEYKNDFLRDPHSSLRDVVGMSTSSISPFFRRRFKIMNAVQKGIDAGLESFVYKDNVILGVDGMPRVKAGHYCQNPSRPRYVHIDLAISGDRCGIAMVCFNGLVSVERGTGQMEQLPAATVELAVSIQPDANNEISIAEIRSWVKQLRDLYGYPIKVVTYDGFESTESRQQWKKEGMRAGVVSVDRTSVPYKQLRDAYSDDRITMYDQPVLIDELFSLEFDETKDKIDHPPNGSKDVADAVCGAYNTMLQRRASWAVAASDDAALSGRASRAEYEERFDSERAL